MRCRSVIFGSDERMRAEAEGWALPDRNAVNSEHTRESADFCDTGRERRSTTQINLKYKFFEF